MRRLLRASLTGLIAIPLLFAAPLWCFAGTVDQGRQTSQRTVGNNWKLPEHERLVFRVKWLAITAGKITVEVKGVENIRGRKAYRIEAHARTTGFCSTVYKVDSLYVSWLDVEKLYTLRQEVHRREGSYRKDAVTDFDQEKHKAYFKSLTDGSEKTFTIPSDTQDTITALFMARLRPLTEKKPLEIRICNNEQNYVAVLKVVEQTSLGVPGRGKRQVLLINPVEKSGKKVRQGRMSGYVSVEPGHEPYLFVIKAPVFTSVTARLVPHASGMDS